MPAGLTTALGAEVVLAGAETRHETTRAGTAVLAERVRAGGAAFATAPGGTTPAPAAAPIAGTATGTAGATGTGSIATAARTATAGATAATRATPASAITEIARRRRELPADTGARHLAATWPLVFLLVFLVRAGLEAAETARLVAVAIASTAATAPIIIAPAALRAGDAIDDVVELAAGDRALRPFLALEHAHEADVVDAIADDIERLEQPLGALGLYVQRRRDGVDRRILLGRLCLALTGRRRGRSFARRFPGRFGRRRRLRRCGSAPTSCRARSRRVTEQQRGEFGEGLHRTG
jgi:hypothetical protein